MRAPHRKPRRAGNRGPGTAYIVRVHFPNYTYVLRGRSARTGQDFLAHARAKIASAAVPAARLHHGGCPDGVPIAIDLAWGSSPDCGFAEDAMRTSLETRYPHGSYTGPPEVYAIQADGHRPGITWLSCERILADGLDATQLTINGRYASTRPRIERVVIDPSSLPPARPAPAPARPAAAGATAGARVASPAADLPAASLLAPPPSLVHRICPVMPAPRRAAPVVPPSAPPPALPFSRSFLNAYAPRALEKETQPVDVDMPGLEAEEDEDPPAPAPPALAPAAGVPQAVSQAGADGAALAYLEHDDVILQSQDYASREVLGATLADQGVPDPEAADHVWAVHQRRLAAEDAKLECVQALQAHERDEKTLTDLIRLHTDADADDLDDLLAPAVRDVARTRWRREQTHKASRDALMAHAAAHTALMQYMAADETARAAVRAKLAHTQHMTDTASPDMDAAIAPYLKTLKDKVASLESILTFTDGQQELTTYRGFLATARARLAEFEHNGPAQRDARRQLAEEAAARLPDVRREFAAVNSSARTRLRTIAMDLAHAADRKAADRKRKGKAPADAGNAKRPRQAAAADDDDAEGADSNVVEVNVNINRLPIVKVDLRGAMPPGQLDRLVKYTRAEVTSHQGCFGNANLGTRPCECTTCKEAANRGVPILDCTVLTIALGVADANGNFVDTYRVPTFTNRHSCPNGGYLFGKSSDAAGITEKHGYFFTYLYKQMGLTNKDAAALYVHKDPDSGANTHAYFLPARFAAADLLARLEPDFRLFPELVIEPSQTTDLVPKKWTAARLLRFAGHAGTVRHNVITPTPGQLGLEHFQPAPNQGAPDTGCIFYPDQPGKKRNKNAQERKKNA